MGTTSLGAAKNNFREQRKLILSRLIRRKSSAAT
jgi:hypothetical protein